MAKSTKSKARKSAVTGKKSNAKKKRQARSGKIEEK